MQNRRRIDLDEARTSPKAKVFAGRERGKYCRAHFRLNELDDSPDEIEVIIPEDIISLNISFFLNMFGESVRKLGKDGFINHYKFVSDPVLEPGIQQGIEQALKRSSALPV